VKSNGPSMLRFFGGAGTVTGSRFLLNACGKRILIDCGLFQGLKELRLRNWDKFPLDPEMLDAIVLTHAHLDHSGYIPLLCRDGFRGPIFATQGTIDLCRIVLPDSGHLQEEEANYANRAGYSKHSPARPLYTEEDAWTSMEHFEPAPFDSPIDITCGIRATFRSAGHILGATTVSLEIDGSPRRKIFFSGDLGRPSHPIFRAPENIDDADVVLVESTYGDRVHDDAESIRNFEVAIAKTIERAGVIVIPSFAVDRTEIVLFHLRHLISEGRIPSIPIYVDSPMALAALRLYKNAIATGGAEIRPEMVGQQELLEPPNLTEVRTPQESIALNAYRGPMVIVSASGMATGGRVLHHLAHRLADKKNTIILFGYQAAGTRGRSLLESADSLKMLGRYIPVRAEVVSVPAFSVHADRNEIIGWLQGAGRRPEVVYIIHGDPPASEALRSTIVQQLGWNAVVPRHLEQVRID
jgi:metallo-beta-lactamase family protein